MFQITRALFLSCISGVLTQKPNYAPPSEKRLYSQPHTPGEIDPSIASWRAFKLSPSGSSVTLLRDISYLPEDDYDNNDSGDNSEEVSQEIQEIERDDRNLKPEYRSLCETKTRKVLLSDSQYEYQPSHYHEVYCKGYSLAERIGHALQTKPSAQMCAHPSFHCVQRSKTLFVVRRRWENDCWEPYSKQVASGCECMWPVSSLGDITGHY